jgi:hypothetical protein
MYLFYYYFYNRSVDSFVLCWIRMEAWAWRSFDLTGWGFDHQIHLWLEETEHISSLWGQGVCSNVSDSSAEWQLQCKLQTTMPKLWVYCTNNTTGYLTFWVLKVKYLIQKHYTFLLLMYYSVVSVKSNWNWKLIIFSFSILETLFPWKLEKKHSAWKWVKYN